MDLPTCPACGQSVLDDDVDDCPFCGASLSGKPSAPAAQQTAAAVAEIPPARAPASPAAPAARKERTRVAEPPPTGEDDPFELERSAQAAKQVVKLRPQAEKGRRHKVACPMCEAVGYTARKAAGRDVRCINPDCKFPVFTAPPLPEGESVSDEPGSDSESGDAGSKKFWTPVNIGVTAVLAVAGVVAIVIFGFGGSKPDGPTDPGGGNGVRRIVKTNPVKTHPKNNILKNVPDPADELRKIQSRALAMMPHSTGTSDQRSLKQLMWHWTVDAHARAGRLKTANEHLKTLQTVAASVPHFEVVPLTALAWQHWHVGTTAEREKARSLAAEALKKLARTVPRRSREHYDAAAALTALLTAVGRQQDALNLAGRFDDASSAAQTSLFLHCARFLEHFDADAAARSEPIRQPVSPLRVSVVILLAANAEWQAAREWVDAQTSRSQRRDCLIALHEASAALRDSASTGPGWIKTVAGDAHKLERADERAILLARVAARLHQRGRKAAAAQLLAQARAALPKATIKQITFQNDRPRDLGTAVAYAEFARAEVLIDDKPAAAWESVSRALALCRSSTVKPAARFAVQTRILLQAVLWKPPALLTQTWDEIAKSPLGRQEPWFDTRVPGIVAMQAEIAGDAKLGTTVRQKLKTNNSNWNDRQQLWILAYYLPRNKNYARVAFAFGNRRIDFEWRKRMLCVATVRLVDAGDVRGALRLLNSTRESLASIAAFELLAARSVAQGKTQEAWKLIESESVNPAQKVAMCHGLLSALRIPEKKPAAKPKKTGQ